MLKTYIGLGFISILVIVAVVYAFIQNRSLVKSRNTNPYTVSPYNPIDYSGYNNPTYNSTSSAALSLEEKTIVYTYPTNACGTLVSDHQQIGSVRPGTGPVFALAAQKCAEGNSSSYPDEYSFRVYSCQNIASSTSGKILGQATFAFQCKSN
ncbi:MAG: hypothetical protein AAB660_00750 [Patescibacteria group bacterium]